MTKSRRKAEVNWAEPGLGYFLTYSCHRRLPLLNNDRARGWVLSAIDTTRAKFDLRLWAYVIMPEHVHVLVVPDQRVEVGRILAALKRPVSKQAKEHLQAIGRQDWIRRLTIESPSRQVFRFWQPGGGYDRYVLREAAAERIIDYIHHNPVRRELVRSATGWTWSSAAWWEDGSEGQLSIDADRSC